ncbi:MAG: SGNH/GDSL hydrolase family protein [Tumebacillaceae bacterium]
MKQSHNKQRPFLIPKLNAPILILIIATFVLIDLFAMPWIVARQHIEATSAYRPPLHFSYAQVKAQIDLINQDTHPRVITVGDSIVNGGGVGSSEDTIANYLQQGLNNVNLQNYHVYNLGLSGAAPADVFFLVKALDLKPQDIVVYDLNLNHYFIMQKLVFPQITAELADKHHNGQPLYDFFGIQKDKLEDRLQLFVSDYWKLYAYRGLVHEMYNEKVKGNKPLSMAEEVNLNPWTMTDWTERTKDSVKRGHSAYVADDPALVITRDLIQETRQRGANILLFGIPMNQEMVKRYNMVDWEGYHAGMKHLQEDVEKEGARYVDYSQLVPSPYFTDSLHPMAKGNEIIAQQLVKDLNPWLTEKGSAK